MLAPSASEDRDTKVRASPHFGNAPLLLGGSFGIAHTLLGDGRRVAFGVEISP